jgi:hypothetical protein
MLPPGWSVLLLVELMMPDQIDAPVVESHEVNPAARQSICHYICDFSRNS